MSSYQARVGPEAGPVKAGRLPGAIGVHEGDSPMPVGVALARGWDAQGRQLWSLTVRDEKLPGLYVLIDRTFVPAEGQGTSADV
jgi:hypothetical protein